MTHDWEIDGNRTRMEIHVYVYRCRHCGCLQIRNGGPDAPAVYKPNDPAWSPFHTMPDEPPCGNAVSTKLPLTIVASSAGTPVMAGERK